MEKRFQIFVSSTFRDLKEERQAAQKAILGMNHMPAGMELFPATDESAWQLIKDVIDTSDYYVLIIGGRYGTLDDSGIGYTEKEYEYATKQNIPIISLLHNDPSGLPRKRTETDTILWTKLESFRNKVEKNHHCSYWQTPDELKAHLIIGLHEAIKRYPRVGWIRSNALASIEATQEILELRKTIERQENEIVELSSLAQQDTSHLAQDSDIHNVPFSASWNDHTLDWRSPDRTKKVTSAIAITWDDLFAVIASVCIEPCPESEIKTSIKRLISDRYKNLTIDIYPNRDLTGISIPEAEFQKIKIQFMAIGYLEACKLTITNNSMEKSVRACQLTPRGQKHLIKSIAITRETQSPLKA